VAHPNRDRDLGPRVPRVLHLDIDAFLASVEQAVHPELAGLPVVIGGAPTDRNLVMSCSYAARAFGVRPGMLLPEAARRCPQAIFRRGDSQAANRLREKAAAILLRFTPKVEIASIDDFFADLAGTSRLEGSACDAAERMRDAIRRELALPVTIGIATSKTVARIAGKIAKPGGVAEILPGREAAFLARMPLEHLPGAGKAIGRALERFGIRTCGELALVPREVLWTSFGTAGLVLHERARGVDRDPVEATCAIGPDGALATRTPKSIRRDSTFEPEEGRREIVEAMLAYVVERAAHKLRAHRATARSVEVRIVYVDTRLPRDRAPRTERFPDASRSERADVNDASEEASDASTAEKRETLSAPSDSTDGIWSRARSLFRALPRRRALVKTVGVSLVGLAPRAGWQNHLYGEGDASGNVPRESREDRHRRLDRAIDLLRAKHGFGRVLRGSSFPLAKDRPLERDGFRLRTPSLNQ
jgi:DNA polymerase-4